MAEDWKPGSNVLRFVPACAADDQFCQDSTLRVIHMKATCTRAEPAAEDPCAKCIAATSDGELSSEFLRRCCIL
jgi:hypothetical protein